MSQSIKERGYFWNASIQLPETSFAPDEAVYGTLEIDDDGSIRLELDGLIDTGNRTRWGIASDGKPISIAGKLKADSRSVLLIEAYSNGGTFSSHNISHEKYVALYCAVSDCEVENLKSQLSNINHIKINCKSYNEMFGLNPIKYIRNNKLIEASYEFGEPKNISLEDRIVIINHDALIPYGSNRSLDVLKIECLSTFEMLFADRVSVDFVATEYRKIHDFFVILSNIRADLPWPTIKGPETNSVITLYFLKGSQATDVFESHLCWVSLPQIGENLSSVMQSWFTKRESIGAGIFLYLSTRRGMEMYSEQKFMTLMWGLEAFHRAISKTSSDERIDAKIARILDAVDPRDRRWLQSRISGPIEQGLHSRIFDLFKKLPLGFSTQELMGLAQKCGEIRNNISHYGVINRSERKFDNQYLSHLFRAVSSLYHARILVEIGVNDSHIERIFKDSFRSYSIQEDLRSVGINIPI